MNVSVTPNDMLQKGLSLVGCQNGTMSNKTCVYRFRGFYGSDPIVYAMLFEDIKTKSGQQVQLLLDYFLMTIYFLRCYPTELQISALFKITEKTARTWIWFYISKIQEMKNLKVCFLRAQF
jgi:hypothetical protein